MRYTTMRYIPMRRMPLKCDVHAHKRHACDIHAYEIHTLRMHVQQVLRRIFRSLTLQTVVDLSRSELQNRSFYHDWE
jgi:hypothetical protein